MLCFAAASLPGVARRRFVAAFRNAGWLDPLARVPFDVLDSPACPPALRRAGPRALARLALFGAGGQGRHREEKNRDQLFQHFSAEIMRESHDPKTLENVANRVLYHPDVAGDGTLASMLRACVAERQRELDGRLRRQLAEDRLSDPDTFSFKVLPKVAAALDPRTEHDQVVAAFERMRRDFDDRLVHHDIRGARDILPRVETLQQRFPDIVKQSAVDRFRSDLSALEERLQKITNRVDQLAASATAAARRGELKLANELLRELSDIHRNYPHVLTEVRLRRIRSETLAAEQEYDHSEAGRALARREKAIAAEVRDWQDAIHTFEEVAREYPDEPQFYRIVASELRRVAREIEARDANWLADLTIELDELREEAHDETGRTDEMLHRFLNRLEAVLDHLREHLGQLRKSHPAAFQEP